MPCMGNPHEVILKVTLAIIQTSIFYTKKEHVNMCSYIISVVYICRIVSCVKGLSLLYPHPYGMHMSLKFFLEIINAKHEACPKKDKTCSIILKKDYLNVTFHKLKSTLKNGYNWLHICGVMVVFLF